MSLLLLLKNPPVVVTPPPSAAQPRVVDPVPTIEIDFQGNPTATYADIQTGQDDGLAFWRVNGNYSGVFPDSRGTHNGTIIGNPSSTAGPYAYDSDPGLIFNGTADGAWVPSATDLTSKGNMTVEGWLRVDTIPPGYRDVIAKRGAWVLQLLTDGRLAWVLKDDNSMGILVSNSVLAVGTWYHVAAVYDSTNISIYINGVLDNQTAYSAGWEAATIPIRFAQTPSGAVPTYQSSQTAFDISGMITVTKPASTAAGDLLIAHMHMGTSGGLAGKTIISSPPSGWQQLAVVYQTGLSDSNVVTTAALYYKIATASEPASYSWNLSTGPTWCAAISRITGVDTLTPIANPAWGVPSSGTSTSTGTHTPDVDNNMVLAFFSMEDPVGGSWSADSGTERYDFGTGSNAMAMYSQTQASASAIQVTGTGSGGSDAGGAFWVAVAGASPAYAAVSMKDWSFSSVARTASELARDYASRSSGTGTWTDVSTSARNLEISGGRQYELDQMEAATVGLDLKDASRAFDPANTSSPYWPNVIPVRKIRGRTTYENTVYDLFFGYIERWPPQDQVPGYQEIGLQAVDGFDALALAQVSGSLAVGFSGAQIHTLLDKALWPKTARAIDAGQYVMAAQTLNTSALSAIQEIAASEHGIFFIDQAGVATFHDSAHRGSFPRSTQSQVTFNDTHASGIFYQNFTPSYDKDKVINDWTVSPDSSVFQAAEQQQEDADAIARFWRRSNSRSTRLASNEFALAQAGNLLNETAYPGLRFDTITVKPVSAAGYHACLGLRISDRVTVIRGNTQKWAGSVLTKDCFVEAKRVSAVGGTPWQFVFALSPVSLGNYRSTIIRDGPVSYWRMDSQS